MVALPSPIILVKRLVTLSLIGYFTPALFDKLDSMTNTYTQDHPCLIYSSGKLKRTTFPEYI